MSDLPDELAARVAAVKDRVEVSALVGRAVKLVRKGREFAGLCPFHQEKTPSFTVNDDKQFYHCFGCGAHGDVIAFVCAHNGADFMDALRGLESDAGLAGESATRRETIKRDRGDAGLVTSAEAGIAVWARSIPAMGTLAEVYLAARGIDRRASGVSSVVRFLPACPVSRWKRAEGPWRKAIHAPAMLAPICRIEGVPGGRTWVQQGVHITFLAADGSDKADLPKWQDRAGTWHDRPSRKIWGEAGAGAVPIPPRLWEHGTWRDAEWLGAPGELVVGEGLESTLSLLGRVVGARGAVATLSLGNLEGGWLDCGPEVRGEPDGRGRSRAIGRAMPLWNLRPDPVRAPFVVGNAGEVVIGVDADMKGLGPRWVQDRPRGQAIRRALSGAERSAICATLAAGHWRLAGADHVRVERPPMGCDFNDLDRRVA